MSVAYQKFKALRVFAAMLMAASANLPIRSLAENGPPEVTAAKAPAPVAANKVGAGI